MIERQIRNIASADSEWEPGRFGMEARQIGNQSSADWESKPDRLGIKARQIGNGSSADWESRIGLATAGSQESPLSTMQQLTYKLLFHIYSLCFCRCRRVSVDPAKTDAGRVGLAMAAGRISAPVVENQTILGADDMPFCFSTADQRGVSP